MFKKLVLALAAIMFMFASVPAAFAARTAVTPQSPVNVYGTIGAGAAQITWTACDTVNFNSCVSTGKEILIFQNTDVSSHNVTITSAPDSLGRTKDIATYAVPASATAFFGPIPATGFIQTDGNLYFQADNALVKVGIVRQN